MCRLGQSCYSPKLVRKDLRVYHRVYLSANVAETATEIGTTRPVDHRHHALTHMHNPRNPSKRIRNRNLYRNYHVLFDPICVATMLSESDCLYRDAFHAHCWISASLSWLAIEHVGTQYLDSLHAMWALSLSLFS